MPLGKRAAAEFLGTFWLVFGGCGSAVLAAAFPGLGIGFLGVALAFGLTLLTMVFRHRPHLRMPSQSRGIGWTGGGPSDLRPRIFPLTSARNWWGRWWPSAVLYVIASGKAGFDLANGFASNGYAAHSPGGYSLVACLVAEIVLTFMFLIIILGATDRRAPLGFAPIPVGLALTLIHLVGIPVTNTSVNPARSTGPALFVGGWAIEQLWLFWVAPLVGAALAGLTYSIFEGEPEAKGTAAK